VKAIAERLFGTGSIPSLKTSPRCAVQAAAGTRPASRTGYSRAYGACGMTILER